MPPVYISEYNATMQRKLPAKIPVLSILPEKKTVDIKEDNDLKKVLEVEPGVYIPIDAPVRSTVVVQSKEVVINNNDNVMAKGKLLGFLGKVGSAIGNVFPAAGVAGKLATNAGEMIKRKNSPAVVAAKEKEIQIKTAITAEQLAGGTGKWARIKIALQDFWAFVMKYWWAFLPALLVLIYLLFFKSKRKTFARRARRRPVMSSAVRRKRSAMPKGKAWAARMLAARRAKARQRK